MGQQRITRWDYQSGGWKKRKKPPEKIAQVSHQVLFIFCFGVNVLFAGSAMGWEEGDNEVNVISVENMDALLRLRMVTELKSLDIFGNNTETEARLRRWINHKPKLPTTGSQVAPLCEMKRECECIENNKDALNVTCRFQSHEVVELGSGSLPSHLTKLHISNAKELRIHPSTFANHHNFISAFINGINKVVISSQAFQNLSRSHFFLKIKDCRELILEEHSFRTSSCPVSATIENCDHVVMKKSVFSWLFDLQIINVPKLEVIENTFSTEINRDTELNFTKISFENVKMSNVPNATFRSSVAMIRFVNCHIESFSSGAFRAMIIESVHIENTTLKRIDSDAFSDGTLIIDLRFSGVSIDKISSNALTAVTNLTIENCSIGEVNSGAFNAKAAFVKLNRNEFRKIRRHAFEIHECNSIVIDDNRFVKLEPESFSAYFANRTENKNEFWFVSNFLVNSDVDTLSFIPNGGVSDKDNNKFSRVDNNTFEEQCHCHLESWVQKLSSTQWDGLFETSYCSVNEVLARCYNVKKGRMKMKNYTQQICSPDNQVICEESNRSYHPDILTDLDLYNTEKTILGVIFLGVVCSVGIMLLILSLVWMKQKGICGGAQRYITPSTLSFFGMFSRLFNRTSLVTTASISRVNIHEYAEIQNQINQQQKQTMLNIDDEISDDEEMVTCEDKATQTLPEELTQELLQSLREKLDDPENYKEARDMIEHLYDLIKVEESCNNNHSSPRTSFLFEEEEEELGGNIYDVIQPRRNNERTNSRRKRNHGGANVVSTGTRVPSPDKLLPINYNITRPIPTIVNEYTEPRDRKSHEYCELPGVSDPVMPDVLATSAKTFNNLLRSTALPIYAEPIVANGGNTGMLNRPLPNKPDQPGTSYA